MIDDLDFQEAIETVREWNELQQQNFYDGFLQNVRQKEKYEKMGTRQHDKDEGFAKDLEGEEFNETAIDRTTKQSLKTQLSRLSATAAEGVSTQNLTVYKHAMELWGEAEDTPELLEYLEKYAEKRTEWNERDDLDPDRRPLQEPRVEHGDSEGTEYVEEILTELVTETMYDAR